MRTACNVRAIKDDKEELDEKHAVCSDDCKTLQKTHKNCKKNYRIINPPAPDGSFKSLGPSPYDCETTNKSNHRNRN